MRESKTFLIVGLGNPGEKYEKTRHNIGFRVLDTIKEQLTDTAFSFDKKFQAQLTKAQLNGSMIYLAKPQTFMNLSGQSVGSIVDYYQIPLDNLLIIHDELDLELGKIRISRNRSAAGHNGIRSIIEILSSQGFSRIRLGIKPQNESILKNKKSSRFVLDKFSKEEKEILPELISSASKAALSFIHRGYEKTASEFN